MKNVLIVIAALIIGVVIGQLISCKKVNERVTTVTTVEHDTTYMTIHDTCFIEKTRRTVRNDTVLLAMVDTVHTVDSVMVEVPIEEKQFDGENYSILTEGFRVKLKSVDITYPEITTTVNNTVTKQKRWGLSFGVQGGWGYTAYGWTLYTGVGVGFGYNF